MKLAVRPTAFELVMKREFRAPRELVFAAWTDDRLVARWWAGTFTILSSEMDVRPGGAWHRHLRRPNGTVIIEHGVYHEVVAPKRLVFTYNSQGGDLVEPETMIEVMFDDLGDRTRLTLRHGRFESDSARLYHEGGWSRCLDRVSAVVSRP